MHFENIGAGKHLFRRAVGVGPAEVLALRPGHEGLLVLPVGQDDVVVRSPLCPPCIATDLGRRISRRTKPGWFSTRPARPLNRSSNAASWPLATGIRFDTTIKDASLSARMLGGLKLPSFRASQPSSRYQFPATVIREILMVGATMDPRHSRSLPIISISRSMSLRLPAMVISSTG